MRIDKKSRLLFLAVFMSLGMTFIRGNSLAETQSEGKILSRQKRYLIFPQGSNVQLVFCLTIGSFPRPTDLVIGLTAALAWELPNKVDPKIKLLHRQSRSIIFPKIEAFLQSIGLDGKSCVLKAICEAGKRKQTDVGKGTFVQELLHAIFRRQKAVRGTRGEAIQCAVVGEAVDRWEKGLGELRVTCETHC